MNLIERTSYLSELKSVAGTPDIKVITGVRRAGKSKLLEAFAAEVLKRNSEANLIRINFNLTQFEELLEYHSLESYVEEHYDRQKDNYLLIDEIQMCEGFERAINSLHASEKYDIYVTGSNAFFTIRAITPTRALRDTLPKAVWQGPTSIPTWNSGTAT